VTAAAPRVLAGDHGDEAIRAGLVVPDQDARGSPFGEAPAAIAPRWRGVHPA
jgi:hypothetical protein